MMKPLIVASLMILAPVSGYAGGATAVAVKEAQQVTQQTVDAVKSPAVRQALAKFIGVEVSALSKLNSIKLRNINNSSPAAQKFRQVLLNIAGGANEEAAFQAAFGQSANAYVASKKELNVATFGGVTSNASTVPQLGDSVEDASAQALLDKVNGANIDNSYKTRLNDAVSQALANGLNPVGITAAECLTVGEDILANFVGGVEVIANTLETARTSGLAGAELESSLRAALQSYLEGATGRGQVEDVNGTLASIVDAVTGKAEVVKGKACKIYNVSAK